MTCSECQDVLLEVARGRATPFVQGAVLSHAAACPACQSHLAQQRALTAGLRAVAVEHSAAAASPGVEARLMAAFESGHAQVTSRRASTSIARRWIPVAASILLMAGAAAWWREPTVDRPAPALPPATRAAAASSDASAPGTVAVPERAGSRIGADLRSPPNRQPRRQASLRAGLRPQAPQPPAARPAPAAGFLTLPSAAGLPDFESGEIVRMDIAITSLPNYGIEIPSGAPAAIEADLLIGQDGQARAIRLVGAGVESARRRD